MSKHDAEVHVTPAVRYQLVAGLRTELAAPDKVIIRADDRHMTVPVGLLPLLMEFSEPRTIESVIELLEGDIDGAIIRKLLHEFVDSGMIWTTDGNSEDEAPGLEQFLQPRFILPENRSLVASGLASGRPVVLRNALHEDLATSVYEELVQTKEWRAYEGQRDFFHFRHHNIFNEGDFSGQLARMKAIISAPKTKIYLSEISGCSCAGKPEFGASWYQPGDYSLPHTDSYRRRSVSYVWHLTKNWDPAWGGSLYWCPSGQYIAPTFNTLILFVVSAASHHCVCPVRSEATERRLSVNGWWTMEGGDRAGLTPERQYSMISEASYFVVPSGGAPPEGALVL